MTPAQYLVQLHSQPLQAFALRVSGTLPTGHEHDVALTFTASYQRLNMTDVIDALALALLHRAAYFAPGEPIPRDVLLTAVHGNDQDAPSPEPLNLEDALLRLDALGLIDIEARGMVRLHRLLAAFVVSVADTGASSAVEQAVLARANDFNAADYSASMLSSKPIFAI